MTHENFCYWLQGFFEISDEDHLDGDQVEMVKKHLDMTFDKVTTNQLYQPLDTAFTGTTAAALC